MASSKSVLSDPMHPAIANRQAPPVTAASISLKTVINPTNHQHEVRGKDSGAHGGSDAWISQRAVTVSQV